MAPADDAEFGGNRPPEPGNNVLDNIRGPIQLGKRRKSTKKRRSKKRKSKKRKYKRKKRSKRR